MSACISSYRVQSPSVSTSQAACILQPASGQHSTRVSACHSGQRYLLPSQHQVYGSESGWGEQGVVCRVFTTLEQLAVAEEKQAELAAEVQQAKQVAAAAEQALAASHAVHDPAQAAQVSTHSSHSSPRLLLRKSVTE